MTEANSEAKPTGRGQRVRVINPVSPFFGWKGRLPGLTTPEDGLAIQFPTLEGPVFFRKEEIEPTDN